MRTKTLLSLLLFLVFTFALSAKDGDEVALVIAGKSISKNELQEKFNAFNAPLAPTDKQKIDKFVERYIYNQLVLEEARGKKLDTTRGYQQELESYKLQLTNSYLTDTITEAKLGEELKFRFEEDLKVNQVFIPFDSTLTFDGDTLLFYNKALEYRRIALEQGFDKVPKNVGIFSFGVAMDIEVETGELGWLKPFSFSYNLEQILYNAKVGEVSMPIRSVKGYHVLQVEARRPALGNPVMEQVILNFPVIPAPQAVKDSVYQVALQTYKEIEVYNNFQTVCDEFAFAHQRGEDGCLLGLVTVGTKIPLPLIKASFEMEKVGEVSKPILTEYGWHIMRLKDVAPLPTATQLDELVKVMLTTEKAFPEVLNRRRLKMMEDNNATINQNTYKKLYALTSKYSSLSEEFANSIKDKDEELLRVDNNMSYTIDDFLLYIELTRNLFEEEKDKDPLLQNSYTTMVKPHLVSDILESQLEGFIYVVLSRYEKETLAEKNPKFKEVIQKLSEELLYTKLLDAEIWTKSRSDVEGLQKIFEKNRGKYSLDKSLFKGMVVFARDEKTLADVKKKYQEQELSATELRRLFNVQAVSIQVDEGLWGKGENKYVEAYRSDDSSVKSSKINFPYYIVLGKDITAPEDFTDVRFQVEADYQKELEEQFAAMLHSKYSITINKAVIKKIK